MNLGVALLIVYLQPLGRALPDADVQAVRAALVGLYGAEVRVLERRELPKRAWYPPRERWRADKLLDFLDELAPADADKVLGLTAEDISTTKGKIEDWGVLGLGSLSGRACVISTFRCKKKTRAKDPVEHARERLAKTAAHEVGHTLGLEHCPTRGCLMEDAEGSVLTTDREDDLCRKCREQLARDGRKLPDPPSLPWPRVL